MQDLYPGPNWSFCFGWASYTEGVAAFSFCRYDPAWDGIEDTDRDKNLLMRGCAIMCHELGHQFGLRHCIYYECLMNGINSAEEQRQGGIRILCPVCHRKLMQNLKFDSATRFTKLAEVCDTLGFTEEASIYCKLLTDAGNSGITAVPRSFAAKAASKTTPTPTVNSKKQIISPKKPSVSPKEKAATVKPTVSPKLGTASTAKPKVSPKTSKPVVRIPGVSVQPLSGIAAAYAMLDNLEDSKQGEDVAGEVEAAK